MNDVQVMPSSDMGQSSPGQITPAGVMRSSERGSEEVLRLEGISKRFGSLKANHNITLGISGGEIHAIIGENGAGKTTLMNILYGIYQADAGTIHVRGKLCVMRSPMEAIKAGITLVSQHFLQVENHDVAENLALSLPSSGWLFSRRRIAVEVEKISREFGLNLDLGKKVADLTPGLRQRLEIVKALMRRSSILIFDEPTSVLAPQEVQRFFEVLRRLREQGCAILFISHKLEEVLELSDRISVLRKGELIGTFDTARSSKTELSRAMMGREITFTVSPPIGGESRARLRVDGLALASDSAPISFHIGTGEILGIAGVAGNGQRELARALTGLQSTGTARIKLDEYDLEGRDVAGFRENGIAHIPEDRNSMGVVPSMTVEENVLLCWLRRKAFRKGLFLAWRKIGETAERLIQDYQIATPSRRTRCSLLSGGNVQKLVFARELLESPRFIVAVHPTYGLDLQATAQVHRYLCETAAKGTSILLISEDLVEVMMLSHRIGVLFNKRLMGVVPRDQARVERLGLWMVGESA